LYYKFKFYNPKDNTLIEEITNNLQQMNMDDFVNGHLLSLKSNFKKELSYEIGKFYSWFYGENNDSLLDYYLERFNAASNSKYEFSINDSEKTLFLKVKMMLVEGAENVIENTSNVNYS